MWCRLRFILLFLLEITRSPSRDTTAQSSDLIYIVYTVRLFLGEKLIEVST